MKVVLKNQICALKSLFTRKCPTLNGHTKYIHFQLVHSVSGGYKIKCNIPFDSFY